MPIKQIPVNNEEEFERLRDRIDMEVSHARHHWTLLKSLDAASADYWREINVSNTFWHLTFIAHHEAVISHLGRLYDDTKGHSAYRGFLKP